jgi:hypothetical protein
MPAAISTPTPVNNNIGKSLMYRGAGLFLKELYKAQNAEKIIMYIYESSFICLNVSCISKTINGKTPEIGGFPI